jgi:hypothetical protein
MTYKSYYASGRMKGLKEWIMTNSISKNISHYGWKEMVDEGKPLIH